MNDAEWLTQLAEGPLASRRSISPCLTSSQVERLKLIAARMVEPVYCVDCDELADSGPEHVRDGAPLCNACASGD
jgi:hypothetical protein